MAETFSIDPKALELNLSASREGAMEFTVTNRSSDGLRARAKPVPEPDCDASWLTVEPTATAFASGAAQVFKVKIKAPAGAKASRYAYRLEVASERNPDHEKSRGPRVSFTILPPPPPPPWFLKYWWILVLAVLLTVAAVGVWWALQGPTDISRVFAVPAEVEWSDTNIDLRPGDQLSITALANQKWANVAAPESEWVGSEGSGPYPGTIAPAAPIAALIAKLDQSDPFKVGVHYDGRPGPGRLFLAMNDVSGTYSDNRGEVKVLIVVKRAQH